ncbi:MAG: LemA family protein [Bacillota bacterium]|nr:LemA family protein [Bacillota bacterium]
MGYLILGAVVLLIIYLVYVYNDLVSWRNKVKDSWSQIDVQLKRRFDLIPNLVNTVKGYARYEGETLTKVVEARNSFMKASSPQEALKANGELTELLGRLAVVVERYPNLKANESYISLQNQLVETENKIGYSRQFYSDTVMLYNNRVQGFPSNTIALLFDFKEAPYFAADDTERENVEVNF